MSEPNRSDRPRKSGQTTEFVTRLTPSQARDVLGRLLEGHPELLSEADRGEVDNRSDARGPRLGGPTAPQFDGGHGRQTIMTAE